MLSGMEEYRTKHHLKKQSSQEMPDIPDGSVNLVVTSPPYPMIEMWDHVFASLDPKIGKALAQKDGELAFDLMHKTLLPVWQEIYRVLSPGGIACINIGDATRKLSDDFRLYNSHSRISQDFARIGFQQLPGIIWQKPTNSPNKFMGSGMLPSNAYVTLEHEHILIFRKSGKRVFSNRENHLRRESAFFWEERNRWFSDQWAIKGEGQSLKASGTRERSGAFPFELAYRLVNMFSIKYDTVLDPFLGTGTTCLAALASERHSIGLEIDAALMNYARKRITTSVDLINSFIANRLASHEKFVNNGLKELKYRNLHHGFPVMTKQEVDLVVRYVSGVSASDIGVKVTYSVDPP